MTKVLSVRVADDVAERVDALAKKKGIERTDLLREFVRDGLNPAPRASSVVTAQARAATSTSSLTVPITTGADLLMERQRRLNKKMGWDQ